MKVRTGFVSNSSSSSFVVIGESIKAEDITDEMIEKSRIFCDTDIYSEGRVSGYVENRDFLEKLKKHDDYISFLKVKYLASGYDEITPSDLFEENKKYTILVDDFDHHFEEDWVLEALEDEYGE